MEYGCQLHVGRTKPPKVAPLYLRCWGPVENMSVDVQEVIQGIIDAGMSGGSYLTISHMTPVKRIFGDPCPGYPKDLRIAFEVCGRSGEIIEVRKITADSARQELHSKHPHVFLTTIILV